MGGTVADLLMARADDDAVGLLFEERSWSWREVVAESAARAAFARSLRRDEAAPFHVGVLLENTPEYLFWVGGAALAGAAVVGINDTRRGEELRRDLEHTDVQVVVTDARGATLLDGAVEADRLVLVDDPAYAPAPAEPAISASATREAILLLLFTSGTTGAPKAVICTQGRLHDIAMRVSEQYGFTAADVCYQTMPLFHGNALMANWAPAMARGACVALRRRFSASGFLPDVRRFGATYFNYVGKALTYILATPELPDDADNPLVRAFGNEASDRDIAEFERRFGCVITEGYGSSEGGVVINRDRSGPPGALGRAGPGTMVVDPDTGEPCPPAVLDAAGRLTNPEAIGELVNTLTAAGFEGYYKNPEATQRRLRNGWVWSGDLGYMDADGWTWFAGRNVDWMRVDGENVAAAPVERLLWRFPDVVAVAVYAVPSALSGDEVMASLELRPGTSFDPSAFGEFLDAQPDLGTKWAPRFVRIVPEMPLTGTLKVQKQGLRRQAWSVDDPVFWRPARSGRSYRPLTAEDRAALLEEFQHHGRGHLVPGA